MLFSLAVIFLVGLSAAAIFQTIGLPRIIGMLATGILTGTYVLDRVLGWYGAAWCRYILGAV